ncbi:hypothetical protein BpHYR1_051305 [Brachionus plicatilis]|uniref:Uncharacterized protein n=1 Tax=Brachionus plicatilis TaxID=10195 RepID=A0A3M7T1D1_BRAPC|nr:hypothetical protein BpHYR1_051305 [Brachionus plicatilis]
MQKRKNTKNLNNPRWKTTEKQNEPEYNVTDTINTHPVSTNNLSSSDSDSNAGLRGRKVQKKRKRSLKSKEILTRSGRRSKPPDRLVF